MYSKPLRLIVYNNKQQKGNISTTCNIEVSLQNFDGFEIYTKVE